MVQQYLSQDVLGVPSDALVFNFECPIPSSYNDLGDDLDLFAESQKYNSSNGSPPTSTRLSSAADRKTSTRLNDRHTKQSQSTSQHLEFQSKVEYYKDCCIHPLHPLGGGSCLAMVGKPSNNPSSKRAATVIRNTYKVQPTRLVATGSEKVNCKPLPAR